MNGQSRSCVNSSGVFSLGNHIKIPLVISRKKPFPAWQSDQAGESPLRDPWLWIGATRSLNDAVMDITGLPLSLANTVAVPPRLMKTPMCGLALTISAALSVVPNSTRISSPISASIFLRLRLHLMMGRRRVSIPISNLQLQ